MAIYEIRRSGTVILRSSIADCGYTGETLKDMARAGLHLYCDGKKVKNPPPGVQDRKTARECNPTLLE